MTTIPQEDKVVDEIDENNMQVRRFIRVLADKTLSEPQTLLGQRVPWLKRLAVFESQAPKLSQHPDFQAANVIGMDAASALTAESLDPQPGMAVLDLCCAPGVKLSAIAELMQKRGVLVGVDISDTRLNTTTSLLRKYKVCIDEDDISTVPPQPEDDLDWNFYLFHCDGRLFEPLNFRGTLVWSTSMNAIFVGGKPLRVPRKRAGRGLRKILARKAREEGESRGLLPDAFDRVLVDAECTTDGRTHVSSEEEKNYKKKKWNGEDGTPSVEDELETEKLQLELLANGFRTLKPGGFLVYSTCSMKEGQNEGVISKFLSSEPKAKLVSPIPDMINGMDFACPSSSLGNLGWRLTPEKSGTSGMFIAKFTKIIE